MKGSFSKKSGTSWRPISNQFFRSCQPMVLLVASHRNSLLTRQFLVRTRSLRVQLMIYPGQRKRARVLGVVSGQQGATMANSLKCPSSTSLEAHPSTIGKGPMTLTLINDPLDNLNVDTLNIIITLTSCPVLQPAIL